MGSRGYKPDPAVTYEKRDDASDDTASDTHCGILSVRPSVMQPCANMWCFTAFYSLSALLTSTLSSYVNSQVTTLERQFGFTSKQTGLIMAANDIGFLMCVLFVSYSSTRLHIPRTLGIATITFGISGLACSLPHFIFGARVEPETSTITTANITLVLSSVFEDLCDVNNITSASCDSSFRKSSSQMSEHVAWVSLVIIVIGMMLQGVGKAPRAALAVTYVDNNTKQTNTGLYMGIIVTFVILGPATAYTLGAIFSRMYVTLQATNLTPKHPKWIGAWWLGFVVFGLLSVVISIPLFWFPRKLPQRRRETPVDIETISKSDNDVNHLGLGDAHTKHIASSVAVKQTNGTGEQHVQTRFNVSSLIRELKGFLSVLARLCGNPIYTCSVISSCFIMFTVSAVGSYTPKYMECMFNLPAYKANYIMAGKSLCASCIGTLIGGYLTKKLKMTAIKALLFSTVVVGFSFFSTVTAMFFQCEQPTVHNWPGSPESCYDECNCEDNKYFAICGQDGKTYYSPCTAGCTNIVNEVYQNCSCIAGGTAVGGPCEYGCNHMYAYAIFSALRYVTGTLAVVPQLILIIRCVEDKDKGFGVGMQAFMTSLFGWLLGPIIIGYVIDGICTVWDVRCGTRGRCLLYDNDLFRVKLHSYCAVSLACSFVVLAVAYTYARCSGCLDEKCPQSKAEASRATTPSPESCYDECNCEDNKYFAICGQDGKTYYSPCTAGCTNIVNEVYQNCSCIAGGKAVGGPCEYGCNHMYAYAIFSALRYVTGTLAVVPQLILIIRCVEDKDKGFGVGMQAFMTSLFGWLLGPIIIGYVIDGICTVWDVRCGTRGRCLLYDNDLFRVKLHSYCAVSLACSFVVLAIAYTYARCSGCLDEKCPQSKAEASRATTPYVVSTNL